MLRSGYSPLQYDMHRIHYADQPRPSPTCTFCATGFAEERLHFLLFCDAFIAERDAAMLAVQNASGELYRRTFASPAFDVSSQEHLLLGGYVGELRALPDGEANDDEEKAQWAKEIARFRRAVYQMVETLWRARNARLPPNLRQSSHNDPSWHARLRASLQAAARTTQSQPTAGAAPRGRPRRSSSTVDPVTVSN